MRVLHAVEAHTIHTLRIAEFQADRGHDVLVATSSDRVGRGPVRQISIAEWTRGLPFSHHWSGLLGFAKLAKCFRPDVLHGHYLSTAALPLLVPCADITIASAVGSDILVDTRAAHARFLVRNLNLNVDRFTSVAPHVTRRLVELGISGDRIYTFPWGADTQVFQPANAMVSSPSLVSTRNFEPVYGVETVLEAFRLLTKSSPLATLTLYGTGSQEPIIKARVRQMEAAQHVEFGGHVGPQELAAGLRRSRIYVSASKSDGASVSLLEAMACGLIPVVSDIEANRQWVKNLDNGLLFKVDDPVDLCRAIKVGLDDDALASRCRVLNPRIISDRGSFRRSMELLEKVYRQ